MPIDQHFCKRRDERTFADTIWTNQGNILSTARIENL